MNESIVAARVSAAAADSLGPWDDAWPSAVEIALEPTPLEAQPSAYVQQAWKDREHGVTQSIRVSAATSPRRFHLRLEWPAESPHMGITDNNVFADACGVMFPAWPGDLPPMMGAPGNPVETWFWRAGAPAPFVATAEGPGTVARRDDHELSVASEWRAGNWAVVFSHPSVEGGLPGDGASVSVAFAAWNGAAEERAGLAAYSPSWRTLVVAPPRGTAR